MWALKPIFWFCALAIFWGLVNDGKANANTVIVPIPTHVAIANAFGTKLAGDPRVTYPPEQVSCWVPAQTKHWFDYQCDATRKDQTLHWRTVVDRMYGLHLKLYEDGSFTFKYKLIAVWRSVTRRY